MPLIFPICGNDFSRAVISCRMPESQLEIVSYDRTAALSYAKKWAFGRNPEFYDFSNIGGDCTNFASQCIYAGAKVMNFTPVFGWYYISADNRTASWTGVEYLYNFLVSNEGAGPFAEEVPPRSVGNRRYRAARTGDGRFLPFSRRGRFFGK